MGSGSRDFVAANTDKTSIASDCGVDEQPLTMICWANMDDVTNLYTVFSQNNTANNTVVRSIAMRGSDVGDPVEVEIADDSADGFVLNAGTYTAGKFYCVGFRLEAALAELFVSGVEVDQDSTDTVGGWTVNTTAFGVKNRLTPANWAEGKIAHGQIYNRVLLDYEMAEIAFGNVQNVPEGLMGWWPLWDNGVDPTLQDISGNGNDMTNDGSDEGTGLGPPIQFSMAVGG